MSTSETLRRVGLILLPVVPSIALAAEYGLERNIRGLLQAGGATVITVGCVATVIFAEDGNVRVGLAGVLVAFSLFFSLVVHEPMLNIAFLVAGAVVAADSWQKINANKEGENEVLVLVLGIAAAIGSVVAYVARLWLSSREAIMISEEEIVARAENIEALRNAGLGRFIGDPGPRPEALGGPRLERPRLKRQDRSRELVKIR